MVLWIGNLVDFISMLPLEFTMNMNTPSPRPENTSSSPNRDDEPISHEEGKTISELDPLALPAAPATPPKLLNLAVKSALTRLKADKAQLEIIYGSNATRRAPHEVGGIMQKFISDELTADEAKAALLELRS